MALGRSMGGRKQAHPVLDRWAAVGGSNVFPRKLSRPDEIW